MAYVPVKEVVDDLMELMRAWEGFTEASVVFRKGPVRALRTSETPRPVIILTCLGLPAGEEGAGIGNHWWHNWQLQVSLLVPDDIDDPEGAEDLRYDLLEEFMDFVHENRTLLTSYKVGRVASVEFLFSTLTDDGQQVYRACRIVLGYKTLKA